MLKLSETERRDLKNDIAEWTAMLRTSESKDVLRTFLESQGIDVSQAQMVGFLESDDGMEIGAIHVPLMGFFRYEIEDVYAKLPRPSRWEKLGDLTEAHKDFRALALFL